MAPNETHPTFERRRIAVTGSTGLIGSALVDALRADGHEVHPIVRGSPRRDRGEIGWDPAAGRIDEDAMDGLDAVFHLAGENVGARWTGEKKRRIRTSRVGGTSLLARTLASLPAPPRVLVSASAIGYYGSRGDEILTEGSGSGDDFLSDVGMEWEAATEPSARAGVRVVIPRLGVVLSPEGGALARMLPVFRLGAGGRLGSGRQWMSWIALPDVVDGLRFLMTETGLSGPVNLMSPEPVTNAALTRALAKVLGRPAVMVVPAAALRLAYGEMADATLLASQRGVPARLLEAGFRFRYPHLEDALHAALGRG